MKRVLLVVGMVLAVGLFAVGCKKEEPVPVPPAKTGAAVEKEKETVEEAVEGVEEEVEEAKEKVGKAIEGVTKD